MFGDPIILKKIQTNFVEKLGLFSRPYYFFGGKKKVIRQVIDFHILPQKKFKIKQEINFKLSFLHH